MFSRSVLARMTPIHSVLLTFKLNRTVIFTVLLCDRLQLSVPDGGASLPHRHCRVQQIHCVQWQDITGHVLCQRDGGSSPYVQRKTNQCKPLKWTTGAP